MSVPIVAFFNNKGGVGKTTLVYHLAWMYADLGLQVVAADLDPQANLTAAFLEEERLEKLWPKGNHPETIYGSLSPLLKGSGDIAEPHLEYTESQLSFWHSPIALLVGDLFLSRYEDQLSETWPKCLSKDQRAFRVTSAFWRIIQKAAFAHQAQIVLVDLGPNLGAINRAALIAADHIVIPLSPDLFSLQGLRNLGPTLRQWREDWQDRRAVWEKMSTEEDIADLKIPEGKMEPAGYIVLQHAVRMDRPVQAYDKWIARIPQEYRESVLNQPQPTDVSVANDPHHLALLKHYRSLIPLAQEARKPLFALKPADGALGSHMQGVQSAYRDFRALAVAIAEHINLTLPQL
jgi:cellulose biosynthesis protein BcsQ